MRASEAAGIAMLEISLAITRRRFARGIETHIASWLRRHCVFTDARLALTSRPRDFHPRALPEPDVNLSIHTAPDVRPLPWHSGQWAKSVGFARRSRSNQSLAPLVQWTIRLYL